MKKLISLFFFVLISFSAFSENYKLFSWNSTKEQILNYFEGSSWIQTENINDRIFSYEPKERHTVIFHDLQVQKVMYLFNSSNKLTHQTVIYSDIFNSTTVLLTMLDIATEDQVKLLNRTVDTSKKINLTFTGILDNNIEAEYMIFGIDNSFQLGLTYKAR